MKSLGVEVSIGNDALGSTDFVRCIAQSQRSTLILRQGDVSYEVPALHPMYKIPTIPGSGNHTAEFTTSAATQEAHDNTLKSAKGIALTAIRAVLVSSFRAGEPAIADRVGQDDAFYERVKSDFEQDKIDRVE